MYDQLTEIIHSFSYWYNEFESFSFPWSMYFPKCQLTKTWASRLMHMLLKRDLIRKKLSASILASSWRKNNHNLVMIFLFAQIYHFFIAWKFLREHWTTHILNDRDMAVDLIQMCPTNNEKYILICILGHSSTFET